MAVAVATVFGIYLFTTVDVVAAALGLVGISVFFLRRDGTYRPVAGRVSFWQEPTHALSSPGSDKLNPGRVERLLVAGLLASVEPSAVGEARDARRDAPRRSRTRDPRRATRVPAPRLSSARDRRARIGRGWGRWRPACARPSSASCPGPKSSAEALGALPVGPQGEPRRRLILVQIQVAQKAGEGYAAIALDGDLGPSPRRAEALVLVGEPVLGQRFPGLGGAVERLRGEREQPFVVLVQRPVRADVAPPGRGLRAEVHRRGGNGCGRCLLRPRLRLRLAHFSDLNAEGLLAPVLLGREPSPGPAFGNVPRKSRSARSRPARRSRRHSVHRTRSLASARLQEKQA